ncbi:hypothetical protein OEA41_005717 [Lepraria neglecta]|uniref:Uncharacterized protein n=1 Tax=Lepraria neglecta TaxID=209136 RepID=A0AAD9Z6K5_9LECA|nr:hypothetical protein OEA41_005717 [Lepraria neglecta]
MAASSNRSTPDMQQVQHSSSKPNDDDTYRIMVLRFEQTEEEVDQHFLQTALELGINIPQDPKTTLDLVTSNVSTLNIDSAPMEPPAHPPSRASQSIHTASTDSSMEQQRHRKTPSLAATSITSASLSSASSRKSNYVKVRESFWRMSRLHRRKTLGADVPVIPPRASSMLRSNAYFNNASETSQVDRVPRSSPPRPPPSDPPPPPPEQETLGIITARRRSMSNPVLKKLRTTQLQEQLRFISFEASQNRLMRTREIQHKRDALSDYHERQKDIYIRHAEALASLEHRHLSAEVDLNRTLELERQACDTRLRHMQAYCNPRSTVQGMPDRVVTKSDYRQLEQQYHIRNGMDNLHASRINVLREKQGKQTERIMAKQEAELEALESDFEHQNEELDTKFREEERQLQQEFAERKKRLVARWNLAEVIERRKLELLTDEEHGPLPAIKWSHDTVETKERRNEREDEEHAVDVAYDAMNMI